MSHRAQNQAEAERAVRRGELKQALFLYRRMLDEDPDDAAAKTRIAAIESLMQPHELSGLSLRTPALPSLDLARPPTLEQTAEMLFERGDVAAALATYEMILKDRPDHDLARERMGELAQLMALTPTVRKPDLPQGKPEMLEALLARIASRRK
jgi:tetratricopeptide (TPR) repeat protein